MSKPVNILEVLSKAYQGGKISTRDQKAIVDAYGRALTMKKILEDFIKVNRNLLIELEYHNCKVPTSYKQIQAMPMSDKVVKSSRDDMSVGSIVDFKLAI